MDTMLDYASNGDWHCNQGLGVEKCFWSWRFLQILLMI